MLKEKHSPDLSQLRGQSCFSYIINAGREGRYSPTGWKRIGMLFTLIQDMKTR